MMQVEPPPDDVNSAGGSALVVHNGAHMHVVPTGGSMVVAAADETPHADLAHFALRLDQMQQELRREKQRRLVVERVVERLAFPEGLVARANQALVAIGTPALQRKGTGFLISSQGHLVTCHHVLLDCNWDQHGSSLVDVGPGESIVWSHKAEVVGWSPTPKPPAAGEPDHRSGKPMPWLDLALLKIVPSPGSTVAGLGPCLHASRFAPAPGMEIALLGYGQQHASDAQTTTFGRVACCTRHDDAFGCVVIDIQGDMLSGQSGGPVIDLRDGGVIGVCISSQTEPARATVQTTINTPTHSPSGQPTNTRQTIRQNIRVPVATGGLHTVIPIAALTSLLGVHLTA